MEAARAPPRPAWSATRWRARLRGRPTPLVLLAIAAAVALLVLLPLGFLLDQALSIGWTQVDHLLFRPFVGTLLVNTVLLVPVATSACMVLGVAVAWCVERTDLPGRRAWAVLAALPITVPAFVTSYSWVSITPAVQGFGGAAMIVTLAYYPLVYLPVAAVLRGMDPALEESARSLGMGPWRTFLRVTLPQTRLALLGGAARRRPPAVRVRRLRDAALSDLHDRDLRRVPPELRRPGRVDARDGARAAVPGAAARRAGAAGQGALRARRHRLAAPAGPRAAGTREMAGGRRTGGARRAGARPAARHARLLGAARRLDELPRRDAALDGRHLAEARARRGDPDDAAGAARLDPHGPPPQPHRRARSNAPPTSPMRCPASSSRCR